MHSTVKIKGQSEGKQALRLKTPNNLPWSAVVYWSIGIKFYCIWLNWLQTEISCNIWRDLIQDGALETNNPKKSG